MALRDVVNSFLVNGPHFNPPENLENQRFTGVVRGYKMRTLARNGLMSQWDLRLILLGHPHLKVCLASIDAFRISSTISQHSFGYPRKITFSRIFFLIFLDFPMFRLHYLSSISQRLSSGTSFPSLNEYFVVLLAAFV